MKHKNRTNNKYDIIHLISHYEEHTGYEEELTANYQVSKGMKVAVITSNILPAKSGRKYQERYITKGRFVSKGLDIIRLPSVALPSNITIIKGVKEVIEEMMPNIIHLHGLYCYSFMSAIEWAEKKGCRIIIDNHEFIYERHQLGRQIKNPADWLIRLEYKVARRRLGSRLLSKARIVIAYEEKCEKFLREFYCFKGLVRRSELGVDSSLFYPNKKKKFFKEKITIGFVGQISRRKRVDMLVKMISVMPPHYTLRIIGSWDTKLREEIDKLANRLNVVDRIEIIGSVLYENMLKEFEHIDCAVYVKSSSICCNQLVMSGIPVFISSDQQLAQTAKSLGMILNLNGMTEQQQIQEAADKVVKYMETEQPIYDGEDQRYKAIKDRYAFKPAY